jgi:hypothetical protein
LFVRPILLHLPEASGIIVDISFDRVLALDQVDIAALAGAGNLADTWISLQILVLFRTSDPAFALLVHFAYSRWPEVRPSVFSCSRPRRRLSTSVFRTAAFACSASYRSFRP